MAPTEGKTYQDTILDKTLGILQSCLCKTTFCIPCIPIAYVNRTLWRNTVGHRFTPSFVRQIVAVKCSQTSGGISSPGYKLNNSTPCLPYLGPEHSHTHTHTQWPRHPPFSTYYVRPQRERVQCRPGARLFSDKAFIGKRQVKEVVMLFLHCVHWDFTKNTVGPKVAVKTNALSLEQVSL